MLIEQNKIQSLHKIWKKKKTKFSLRDLSKPKKQKNCLTKETKLTKSLNGTPRKTLKQVLQPVKKNNILALDQLALILLNIDFMRIYLFKNFIFF